MKDPMLNKLFSRSKAADAATQNPAEAAAEMISTPAKTASLVARLEAARGAEPKGSLRHQLLSKQLAQASIAAQRFEIDAERQRVTAVVQRDKAAAEKALADANEQQAIATGNLKTAQARHQAISARLEPLVEELKNSQREAEEYAAVAQREFDSVVAAGDGAAEAVAANKLFLAQSVSKNGTALSGPLGLRIEALLGQLAVAVDMTAVQEKAIKQAEQARLKAKAELALVEYDCQAQTLLDAYVTQRIAVLLCDGGGRTTLNPSGFSRMVVDQFEVQISSTERIIFGSRINVYHNRYLPHHIVALIRDATAALPDLSVLASKVEDLPLETADPVDQEDIATTDQAA